MIIDTFQQTITSFEEKSGVLTRRSAGLPSIIIGVLSATSLHGLFDAVTESLCRIAGNQPHTITEAEELQLPQVHGLNCLKDIFTDSRFGVQTERHIPNMLRLATESIDCHV